MTNKRESKAQCCSRCTTYKANEHSEQPSSNTAQHVWWTELYAPLLVDTLTKEYTTTAITFKSFTARGQVLITILTSLYILLLS